MFSPPRRRGGASPCDRSRSRWAGREYRPRALGEQLGRLLPRSAGTRRSWRRSGCRRVRSAGGPGSWPRRPGFGGLHTMALFLLWRSYSTRSMAFSSRPLRYRNVAPSLTPTNCVRRPLGARAPAHGRWCRCCRWRRAAAARRRRGRPRTPGRLPAARTRTSARSPRRSPAPPSSPLTGLTPDVDASGVVGGKRHLGLVGRERQERQAGPRVAGHPAYLEVLGQRHRRFRRVAARCGRRSGGRRRGVGAREAGGRRDPHQGRGRLPTAGEGQRNPESEGAKDSHALGIAVRRADRQPRFCPLG